ncbi:MAG TPA: UvrD-helicase domain-containing protein [Longimicrobiales bacterium]|nr:UvrD-helicase domain-containing protein [Longimicrobiales bacterium]
MSAVPPIPMLPRELVLASAGSGKTYHLSSRIIELLALGAPPGEVLASTFTRKAAGEILDRVLLRLAEGAADAGKAQELGEHAHPSLTDPSVCRSLLTRLVGDLHQMNVGTLDAFFIRVARSFFQELGLAPGWTIADKPMEERLRTEAVHAALADVDRAEFAGILRMLNRGGASRNVHDDLVKKVDDLVRIRRQLDPDAVDPWSPDFGVTSQLTPEEIASRAGALAVRLRALDVPLTKKGTPAVAWVKARDGGAGDIEARDWEAVLCKGIGAKVFTGEEEYSRCSIPDAYVEVYQEAIELARTALAADLRLEAEALGRLAELLETAFDDAQRQLGAYRFEDVTHLLGGPDGAGGRDDLHYRLDQQVRHILLDEFQDTSLEQWQALSPLADELLSGHLDERAGVIVADPKQSIYGWRGARPELVRQVGRRYALSGDTMAKSWRSSAVVLDFVADVFRKLPANTLLSMFDVGPRVASDWMEDFTELEPAADVPGHVRVHRAPEDDGTGAIQPNLLRHAAEIVRDLHVQMPGRSIGVLVRRNKVLGHLINELQALGVRASGEGGTPLTDTPPVNAVLSLLRLADHPTSRAALYHVARSPLGEVVGLHDHQDGAAASAVADRVRRRLIADGYGPTIAAWVREIASRCDEREVRRLLQLVGLGHRWDERPTLRPGDFARFVAREPVEDPSSAPVRVMTVHRSKGLEFDVVVLPELYASLCGRAPSVTPERDPATGRVVKVYPKVKKSLLPLFPDACRAVAELEAADLRDGLSLLYVALTRARYALHLVVPPEGGSAKHGAALIRAALALDDGAAGESGLLWERGDPQWWERRDVASRPVPPAPLPEERPVPVAAAPLLKPAGSGTGRNLARRSPSSMEGGAGVDLAFHLKLDAGPALMRGSVVHAWCEAITWIEDGVPADDALRARARKEAPGMRAEAISELIAEFHAWLAHEDVRQALGRGAYDADPDVVLRVENELPFVRRVGDEIQEGFIDRLVLIERGGRVIAAEVLDFKTDRISAADEAVLAARTEHYRPQIEEYCHVVKGVYGLDDPDVRGTLVFLDAGVVREVVGDPVRG